MDPAFVSVCFSLLLALSFSVVLAVILRSWFQALTVCSPGVGYLRFRRIIDFKRYQFAMYFIRHLGLFRGKPLGITLRALSTIETAQLQNTWVTSTPRTSVTSASAHSAEPSASLGRFYTVETAIASRVISPFLTEFHLRELRLFEDFSLLVRKPAIDVISALRHISDSCSDPTAAAGRISAVPRFVLYGQPGCGISVQLAHIAQYAAEQDYLIFAFCNAENWLDRCPDFIASDPYHQKQHQHAIGGEALDFPQRSAEWLTSFLALNEPLIKKLNPTITRPVEWTVKDIAPVGTPWSELIDFALKRTKYSTDCIGILLREMRALSSSPEGPSSLLLIDGVNFLWCRGTRMQDKVLGKKVAVDRLAIVHHLRRALVGDWQKGAIVTSVNERAAWPSDREKYTPGYLLTKRGFETMDPFIPIHVENYAPSELDAVLQFYAEHGWFTNPAALTPEGRAEIVFLADNNPRELSKIAAEW
ncbi:28S ribosomal protein S29, mitochondrial [Sparganum proliferum]